MTVSIINPVQATYIFICIGIILLACSMKRRSTDGLSNSVSTELKGFAILMVIFAHIGYILSKQHEFLFPISILAGVGVNLFLFLSGYGLTISQIKKNESILKFYKKRLPKLFVPFWIVLVVLLVLDYVTLDIVYTHQSILKAFLGIFTQADALRDINSPMWYFTLILVYYLLFPLLFSKRYPWISAIILYFFTWYVLYLKLDFFKDVLTLYKVHLLAFPLGMVGAWFSLRENQFSQKLFSKIKELYVRFEKYLHSILVVVLLFIIGYTAIHSGVGEKPLIEQTISLVTMFAVILLFIIKKYEFRILTILGIYSYEIYLFHWPLMYRYDLFYKYVPAWLATLLYFFVFIGLARVLKKVSNRVIHVRQNPKI